MTIRSYDEETVKNLEKEFHWHQDNHSGVWYTIIVLTMARGIIIDGTISLLTAFVAYFYIFTNTGNFTKIKDFLKYKY